MKPRGLGRLLPFYACTACLSLGIGWGQNTNSADVTGTVTDPSGAVVPGVAVTIHDVDKNTERSVVAKPPVCTIPVRWSRQTITR